MTGDRTTPAFRTIAAPLEVHDRELDALNDRLGVPTLKRGAPGMGEAGPLRAPVEKLTLEVPVYLGAALRRETAEKRMSVRYLVMVALKGAGYAIEDIDLVPDGRRDRGRTR